MITQTEALIIPHILREPNRHGQRDTKDGHLWEKPAIMEKTGSYGKDGNKARFLHCRNNIAVTLGLTTKS